MNSSLIVHDPMNGPPRRFERLVATVEWSAIIAAIGAACYLSIRPIDPERSDWVMGTFARFATYFGAAVFVAIGLIWARRRRSRLLRVPAFAVALVLTLMTIARLRAPTDWHWPPRRADSMAARLDELTPKERATWGARVAMHRITTRPDDQTLTIPPKWSFPADVAIAIQHGVSDTVRVWARTADGTTRCTAVPTDKVSSKPMPMQPMKAQAPQVQPMPMEASATGCAEGIAAPPREAFVQPLRSADTVSRGTLEFMGESWPQYRRDASKTATITGTGNVAGWHSHLDGEIRASVSVVGRLGLIGAHASGTFGAFDIATGSLRWSSRVPNWIHQDAVSDGRIAVVGFGDNNASFAGRTPSGVAAYAVSDGRHLWTRFDETSVMTSPIIRDSIVVYASSAGVLRKRLITNGALLAELQLPGGVVMGSPASIGDTIVFGLDLGGICALLISSMETLWCRTMPYHRETGHSAPTIANGEVISSSILMGRAISVGEFFDLPAKVQWALFLTIVEPRDGIAGQRFQAFRLRDGMPLWSSRLFPTLRVVRGHPAGTAAVHDTLGVIALPLTDSLVAFDIRTGRVLWTAGAHGSRGPPLLIDSMAVNAGRDGTTEVRDLDTGRLICSMSRATGYDRAGPAIASGLLLFADLNGGLEAIPSSQLLKCDSVVVRGPPL